MNTQTYSSSNLPPDTINIVKRGVVWRAGRVGSEKSFGYGTEPQKAIDALLAEEQYQKWLDGTLPEDLADWLKHRTSLIT